MRKHLLISTLLLLGVVSANPAIAGAWSSHERGYIGRMIQQSGLRTDQNEARAGVRSGKLLPLGKVLAKVHSRYPGRLLDAQLVNNEERPVYFIKLMTKDGNVANITADAATGEVLDYRQGGS